MKTRHHDTEQPERARLDCWMPFSRELCQPWQRYLVPLGALLAACAVRSTFLSFLGTRLPFVTFLPVIVFTFLYSGVYPGILTILFSACFVTLFLDAPLDHVMMVCDTTERLLITSSLLLSAVVVLAAWAICLGQKRAAEAERQAKEAAQRALAEAALRETEARYQEAMAELNVELERRVVERTAKLEAAIREQEAFSYSVSHDLRAPLRHINSFSSILMEDHAAELSDEARAYLQRIRQATRRMGDLIDHLLELSRLSRAELVLESVDLSRLASDISTMLKETEPHRQVEVNIEDGLWVRGDRNLLGQLLVNLLGNAWKYSSVRPVSVIEVGSRNREGEREFFVRDNGVGFDMAHSGKLFEVFQRLHGAEFEGTGIGLATAQRIVKRHGGTIRAEGATDRGATFYFTLTPSEQSLKQSQSTADSPPELIDAA